MAESTRTAEEAAAACSTTVERIVKSLVFQGKESGKAILLLVSGANRVKENAVGRLIGEKIVRPDAAFVREATGFAIGGIPPFGQAAPLATWWERGTLRARQYRSDIVTPFASVLEVPGPDGWEGGPWGAGPRTVLVARHENLGARLGRVETLDEALCLTVLHGKNVSNGRGRFGWVGQWLRRWRTRHEHLPRAAVRRLLEDFGLGGAA